MKKRVKQKRKREGNFWKKNYSLSWNYIKKSRNYIIFIILVFLFGSLLALFFQPPEIVELIKGFVKELLERTKGLNSWQMIIFILNNNLKNSFFAMIFGVFLGVFPVFTALANGYVLGFIAEKSVAIDGLVVLWRLFPHGVFELPAVILALALGTKFGLFWTAREKKKEFLKRLESSLRVFLFVILPLLIIAAIIEGILIFL
jgi:stage II sporulation protein M